MLTRLPAATIRTQVELPLRFADGYATDARVFSFDGLVDDREAANLRYLETKARLGSHTLDLPSVLSGALNGRTR